MLDSDDALLLEPTYRGARYPAFGGGRETGAAHSLTAITVAYLSSPITASDRELAETVRAELAAAAGEVIAAFVTHGAENNFPALSLRDENVLGWVTRFADDDAPARHRDRLANSTSWRDALGQLAARGNRLPMQHLRLRPTDHSQLR